MLQHNILYNCTRQRLCISVVGFYTYAIENNNGLSRRERIIIIIVKSLETEPWNERGRSESRRRPTELMCTYLETVKEEKRIRNLKNTFWKTGRFFTLRSTINYLVLLSYGKKTNYRTNKLECVRNAAAVVTCLSDNITTTIIDVIIVKSTTLPEAI